MLIVRNLVCAAMMIAALLTTRSTANAADYPAKRVEIVAPFTAGGGTDIIARLIAQKLSDVFKQPFVVENKPGATGIIGADYVAKAAPDGYTLLMGSNGPNAINGAIYPHLPYDPARDFTAVSLVATVPNVLLVSPETPAKSVKELIALARAKPGQLTFGSAGVGSPAHLAAVMFESMSHVQMVHVPYKGGSATLPDLLSGRLNLMFADQLAALPLIKSGKVRALAVTTAKRSSALPEVPTMSEAGLPGYNTAVWYVLSAPAGTPKAIVAKLNAELVKLLKTPDMRTAMSRQGAEVVASSPEEAQAFIRGEIVRWKKLASAFGIRREQ